VAPGDALASTTPRRLKLPVEVTSKKLGKSRKGKKCGPNPLSPLFYGFRKRENKSELGWLRLNMKIHVKKERGRALYDQRAVSKKTVTKTLCWAKMPSSQRILEVGRENLRRGKFFFTKPTEKKKSLSVREELVARKGSEVAEKSDPSSPSCTRLEKSKKETWTSLSPLGSSS